MGGYWQITSGMGSAVQISAMQIISRFITWEKDVLDAIGLPPPTGRYLGHTVTPCYPELRVTDAEKKALASNRAAATTGRLSSQRVSLFEAIPQEIISRANIASGQCCYTAKKLFEGLTGVKANLPAIRKYSSNTLLGAFDSSVTGCGTAFLCQLAYYYKDEFNVIHSFFVLKDKENQFKLYQAIIFAYCLEDWLSGDLKRLNEYQADSVRLIDAAKSKITEVSDDEMNELVSDLERQKGIPDSFHQNIIQNKTNQVMSRSEFYNKVTLAMANYLNEASKKQIVAASKHYAELTGTPLRQSVKNELASPEVKEVCVLIQSAPVIVDPVRRAAPGD